MMNSKIQKTGRNDVFWPITTMLGVLWLLGLLSGYTLGGAVHLLLVGAIVMVLFRLLQGRRLA